MHRLQFFRDLPRLVLVMVASTVAAPSLLAQGSPAAPPNLPTILTTGEAIVRRAPDVAYLTLAVESRAKCSRDAQRQNADVLVGVQRQLSNSGVARGGGRLGCSSNGSSTTSTDGGGATVASSTSRSESTISRVREIADTVVKAVQRRWMASGSI